MNIQKKEEARLQKIVAEHEFSNTHADRDCIVCGKPLSAHGQTSEEPKRKPLFS